MAETGHAKYRESLRRLIDTLKTFDQTKLVNMPVDIRAAALETLYATTGNQQTGINDQDALWRTSARDKSETIDALLPMASQVIALYRAQGMSKANVAAANGYARSMRGRRKKSVTDDPATPNINEAENKISAAHTSDAQVINFAAQLIEFLEIQPESAAVLDDGFTIPKLRDRIENAQNKNEATIAAYAGLKTLRNTRDQTYYGADAPTSVRNRVARVKQFVKGIFGANSVEYQTINAVKFVIPGK